MTPGEGAVLVAFVAGLFVFAVCFWLVLGLVVVPLLRRIAAALEEEGG